MNQRPRRGVTARRACQNCRKRHSLCDGEPTCFQCSHRHELCIYGDVASLSPTPYLDHQASLDALNIYMIRYNQDGLFTISFPNREASINQLLLRVPCYSTNNIPWDMNHINLLYHDFLLCSKVAIGFFEKKNLQMSLVFGNTCFLLLSHLITTGAADQFRTDQKILILATIHESVFYWIQLLEKSKCRTLCWQGKQILETIAIPDEGFRVPVNIEIQQIACLAYATSRDNEKLNYLLQVIELLPHLKTLDPVMLCKTAFMLIAESDPTHPVPNYKGPLVNQSIRFLFLIAPSIDSSNSCEAKALHFLLRILFSGNPSDPTLNTNDISHVFTCLDIPNLEPWGYWLTNYALCVSLALKRIEYLQRNQLVSQWWEYYNLWLPYIKELTNTGFNDDFYNF